MDGFSAAQALQMIAAREHVPVEQVRSRIEQAMAEAKASADPAVRERWQGVPSGSAEEFLEHLLSGLMGQGSGA